MGYEIREMAAKDAEIAWNWAADEGWNPGVYDWKIFPTIDPHGFFAGFIDGEMMSSISAVQYEGIYGFMGMYMVKPEYRGKGYGLKIWNHAMGRLNTVGVERIGLDGVLEQVEGYRRSGFIPAYKTTRYAIASMKKCERESRPLRSAEEIAEYDRSVFIFDRTHFLRALISSPGTISFVETEENKVEGYVVARECIEGYKIGPCFADNAEAARRLIDSVLAELRGKTVFIDVPEVNRAAIKLIEEYKANSTFACMRMYRGKNHHRQDLNRVFGNTSLEVG